MSKQQFDTNDSPHLIIRRCKAALTVVGWQRQMVTVEGDGTTAVRNQDGGIEISNDGNGLIVAMPINGRLTTNAITPASITIKHLHGDVQIDSCGDLTLNDTGQVQAELVDGMLTAENGNGRLHINHVTKAVTLRRIEAVQINKTDFDLSIQFATGFVDLGQVDGNVTLNSINGDVTLAGATGDVDIQNIGGLNNIKTDGNLTLRGTFAHGEQRFTSNGNIVLDWPYAILSPVTVLATAVSIQNDLPLSNITEEIIDGKTKLNGHIEQGKSFLILKANGRLHLTDSTTSRPPAPPLPRSPAPPAPSPAPETRRHILQLLKDDLLSINQAELLLAALNRNE